MIKKVTEDAFIDAFDGYGRGDQFSPAARQALYRHITEQENELGADTELDVIALCCEWGEYPSAMQAAEACGIEVDNGRDEDADMEDVAIDALREKTTVIELWKETKGLRTPNGVLVQCY